MTELIGILFVSIGIAFFVAGSIGVLRLPDLHSRLHALTKADNLGLGLLSAAALAFEIILTRLFSVTEWYHFAFLAVSVALLGYGASGTLLSLVPRWTRPPTTRRASILAALFGLGVLVAYLCLNYLPFDSYRIAWQRSQLLYLVLYYLALTHHHKGENSPALACMQQAEVLFEASGDKRKSQTNRWVKQLLKLIKQEQLPPGKKKGK